MCLYGAINTILVSTTTNLTNYAFSERNIKNWEEWGWMDFACAKNVFAHVICRILKLENLNCSSLIKRQNELRTYTFLITSPKSCIFYLCMLYFKETFQNFGIEINAFVRSFVCFPRWQLNKSGVYICMVQKLKIYSRYCLVKFSKLKQKQYLYFSEVSLTAVSLSVAIPYVWPHSYFSWGQ